MTDPCDTAKGSNGHATAEITLLWRKRARERERRPVERSGLPAVLQTPFGVGDVEGSTGGVGRDALAGAGRIHFDGTVRSDSSFAGSFAQLST